MPIPPSSILSLDVGSKRIGIAVASFEARLPRPLTTLINDETFIDELTHLIEQEHITQLVIGYPRGLEGQSTGQTEYIEAFVNKVKVSCHIPIALQDEAVTSKAAEIILIKRGQSFSKSDIDALAATIILEDYLRDNVKTGISA